LPLPAGVPDELRVHRGLLLRAVQDSDWPLDFALSRDPAVLAGTSFPPELSEQAARERVARAVLRRAAGESARFVLEREGDVVGLAGVAARGNRDVEVYYALLPVGRGLGLAADATRCLAEWATQAGAPRVVLGTFPENEASQRTARRCSFVPIGSEERRGDKRQHVILWVYQPRLHGPRTAV
jgi:RimJ/RimL family protein N-acetyltransferase